MNQEEEECSTKKEEKNERKREGGGKKEEGKNKEGLESKVKVCSTNITIQRHNIRGFKNSVLKNR